jgi:site-specific recombinase XerD
MQAGKQAVPFQDTIKQFKQDLAARGYSTRTAEVYATAVSAFLKTVPNPASPTPEDADNYIRGILDGTSKGGASQSSVGIAASAIKLLFKHQFGKPLELSVELKRRARPMPSILLREEIQKIVGSGAERGVVHARCRRAPRP